MIVDHARQVGLVGSRVRDGVLQPSDLRLEGSILALGVREAFLEGLDLSVSAASESSAAAWRAVFSRSVSESCS